jgi:hypothetical protein
MNAIVGIDFDNTLVSYDALIHAAALERGLISGATDALKRAVRDEIRRLPDGEIEWQRLQALVYGPLMPHARLIEDARTFVRGCHDRGISVYVISHKTEYAAYDDTRTNLRTAALEWMRANRFFDADGLGLRPEHVFFEGSRDAKIARIIALRCTHFIDDLEEVFREPSFPSDVEKLLYAPDAAPAAAGSVRVMPAWSAIRDYFFGHAA